MFHRLLPPFAPKASAGLRHVGMPVSGVGRVAVLGLVAALAAGCGAGAPAVEVLQDDLEERVGLSVRESLGVEPVVECHEDLEGRVDSDTTCTVHVGERAVIASVVVTKVDDDDTVHLSISLAEPIATEPEGEPPSDAPEESGEEAPVPLPLAPDVTVPAGPAAKN